MDKLAEALGYVTSVTRLIAFTGVCIGISPFVFITTKIWIKNISKLTLRRSSVSFRYNFSSLDSEVRETGLSI